MSSSHMMFIAVCFLLFSSIGSTQTFYTGTCPLLNLYYPAPSSYASSTVVQSAVSLLSENITQALNQSTVYGQLDSQGNAFSIDVYSLQDGEPLFTYHHTGDEITAQHSQGVLTVDSNTVYRIGSISKMMTVYIYLIAAGDETWNQPITRFVPELAAYAQMNPSSGTNMVQVVDWDAITVGSLASHLSGIAREETYSPAGEQALQSLLGLPPPTRNESAMCGDETIKIPCDRQAFFDDFLQQYPFTTPFKTPIYSNVGFQILGYAIENITGKSMSDLFDETFVQRLGLNNTYYSVPSSPDTSIVPVNTTASLWFFDARGETPTGGYFTSVNDMRKIGQSILNSTLLTRAQTGRWMKPHAFTANPDLVVGAPWEILRAPGDPVQWVYSKTGSFGAYAGIIALMPEYNVGITVLGAGSSPVEAVGILSDILVDSVVPTVYAASQAAAVSAFAGSYANTTTNSSITISAPDTGPGLVVSEWTLNGTSGLSLLGSYLGLNETIQSLNVTLYASGLTSNNGAIVSWRAIFRVSPQVLDPGVFSENCVSWGSANVFTYSGVGLDEFVFSLDEGGTAKSVEPRVLGFELMRANGSAVPASLQRLHKIIG